MQQHNDNYLNLYMLMLLIPDFCCHEVFYFLQISAYGSIRVTQLSFK